MSEEAFQDGDVLIIEYDLKGLFQEDSPLEFFKCSAFGCMDYGGSDWSIHYKVKGKVQKRRIDMGSILDKAPSEHREILLKARDVILDAMRNEKIKKTVTKLGNIDDDIDDLIDE